MTLLSTVQRAAILLKQPVPSTVLNATGTTRELVEYARIDAEEAAARHEWSGLVKDHTFTTVAAELQPTGLPADFGRMSQADEKWNRTGNLQLLPLSAQNWAATQASAVTGVFNRWRVSGGGFYLVPAPTAGETVAYPYISTALYRDPAEVTVWDADTETCVIPEALITLGIVWRWKHSKGFDYGEDMNSYERAFERATSADGGGMRDIQLTRARWPSDVEMAYPGVIIP